MRKGSLRQESMLIPVPCSGVNYYAHLKTSHRTWLGSWMEKKPTLGRTEAWTPGG